MSYLKHNYYSYIAKHLKKRFIAVVLAISLFLSFSSSFSVKASASDTINKDDILSATMMLEDLLNIQYEQTKQELVEMIQSNGWNRMLTELSFDNLGNPYASIDYPCMIAALCLILEESDAHINELQFINLDTSEAVAQYPSPYKTERFIEVADGLYKNDGIYYITTPGYYSTYEEAGNGYYKISGETYIELEQQNIIYGECQLTVTTEEELFEIAGLNMQDYETRYTALLCSIRSAGYSDSGLQQSTFIQSCVSTGLLSVEAATAVNDALSSLTGNQYVLLSTAASLIGAVPYDWGGKASLPGYDNTWWTFEEDGRQKGLDCSGFVQWVYMTAGYPEDVYSNLLSTGTMLSSLTPISKNELLPGDIGILHAGDGGINHTGIYVGNDFWIHCNASDGTVSVTAQPFSLYFRVDTLLSEQLSTYDAAPLSTGYSYTDADLYLLSQCVWHEARGEGVNGWIAVAEVVMNRVASPLYPDTIHDVIYQTGSDGSYQFSYADEIAGCTPSEDVINITRMVLDGKTAILNNKDVLYFRRWENTDAWGSYPFYKKINNHAFYTQN